MYYWTKNISEEKMLIDVGAVEKFWKAFNFPNHIWKKKTPYFHTDCWLCMCFLQKTSIILSFPSLQHYQHRQTKLFITTFFKLKDFC